MGTDTWGSRPSARAHGRGCAGVSCAGGPGAGAPPRSGQSAAAATVGVPVQGLQHVGDSPRSVSGLVVGVADEKVSVDGRLDVPVFVVPDLEDLPGQTGIDHRMAQQVVGEAARGRVGPQPDYRVLPSRPHLLQVSHQRATLATPDESSSRDADHDGLDVALAMAVRAAK